MSTEYVALVGPRHSVTVIAHPKTFDLMVRSYLANVSVVVLERMKPVRLVQLAMTLLQLALYHVPDPEAFMEKTIKPYLAALRVTGRPANHAGREVT